MSDLILGVGPGLFAVIFTSVIAFLIFAAISYCLPDYAVFIFLASMCLPISIYLLILSAPYEDSSSHTPKPPPKAGTHHPLPAVVFYKEDGPSPDADTITDYMIIVRVGMVTLACLGVLLGAGYSAVSIIIMAPPYTIPRVQCRRRQLEALHPSWYK
eukprot:Tbor_TRINITY_DN5208_c0_g1::TRINITY_DN5208_c0_g1_i1::g.16537::m.16537